MRVCACVCSKSRLFCLSPAVAKDAKTEEGLFNFVFFTEESFRFVDSTF